ncbi:MAG TPA: lysophospholipid transporter LplT [Methylococcaceae bacterium]|nr:lysophospholipid transporter LplT [Methylococcaceae bacterium]
MNRSLQTLIGAQFLSAFGDNAILFTVIALTLREGGRESWYIPALQSAFILAFILLTPWVGRLADRQPKPLVLLGANMIKALGALAIAFGIEPLLGYAVIGIGAASYGPAKYGIIPDLSAQDQLVRANGWVEGATIAAILTGTVGGARLADYSIPAALAMVIALYFTSGLATLFLPRSPVKLLEGKTSAWGELLVSLKHLVFDTKTRLILIALSLFWSIAATLRVVLVAWAPEVLHADSASAIANLTFFMAIGIVIGAAIVPRLIPLNRVRRTRFAAYLMGLLFILMASVTQTLHAEILLLGIGIFGGMIVVPLNASVQEIGHHSIGSGRAVAAQNFFQNSAILLGMGLYSWSAAQGITAVKAILFLGGLVVLSTWILSRFLPKRQEPGPASPSKV